jgi:lipopolysaccharide export LptBFGC system permease protein LptF
MNVCSRPDATARFAVPLHRDALPLASLRAMSRTLFGYIFWDLIRIFLLASGVLSAIMNFGGLLKPLYEHGLDIGQVLQILAYAGPAMTAYSLPIAALFATTIVYGRFGADNEVTACRAAGISHLSMAMPAFVLGLVTAFLSVGLLCFVVPASMLKVEKIIYSNIAQLAANQIERTHQIRFDPDDRTPVTIFAQSARVLPVDPQYPTDQAVEFTGPLIVQYEKPQKTDRGRLLVPEDFYMAQFATAYIREDDDGDGLSLMATLVGGSKFPRSTAESAKQGMRVTFEEGSFGPVSLPSPVPENTKFMDINRLRETIQRPEDSRRVGKTLKQFIARDQQEAYLQRLADALNGAEGKVELIGANESYLITRGASPAVYQNERLNLTGNDESPVRIVQTRGGQLSVDANDLQIRAYPNPDRGQISAELVIKDCVVNGDPPQGRAVFPTRVVSSQMPDSIAEMSNRTAASYLKGGDAKAVADQQELRRNVLKLYNSAVSEINARMSFAVSCFILVMVGCALGMMFRSGNFLSAFAVSVIPALLSIALVVTGQHTCENIPSPIPHNWTDPLNLGLAIIWSGNAAVLVIATTLLARLQRQ